VAGPFDRTIGGDFDADADADADLYADVGCGGEVVLPPRGLQRCTPRAHPR